MQKYTYNFLLFTLIFTFNFIFSAQVSFTNSEMDAGESTNIDLILENELEVAGFQFQILDVPNSGAFTDVQSTERTSNFIINPGRRLVFRESHCMEFFIMSVSNK